jgi:hypothetical protein
MFDTGCGSNNSAAASLHDDVLVAYHDWHLWGRGDVVGL